MSVLRYVMCACAQTVAVTFIIKHVRNWTHNIFRLGLPHGQSSHDCVKENKKHRWWVWSVLLLYPLNESFYLLSLCVNLCSHPVYASPNLLHGGSWYLYGVLADECFYVYKQKCPVSVPHSWLNCFCSNTHSASHLFVSSTSLSIWEGNDFSSPFMCAPSSLWANHPVPVWLCPTFHLPEKASPQPGTSLNSPFWVLPCDSVDFFNRDGKFLSDCRSTFRAFTLFPNITLKKREVQPCEGTKSSAPLFISPLHWNVSLTRPRTIFDISEPLLFNLSSDHISSAGSWLARFHCYCQNLTDALWSFFHAVDICILCDLPKNIVSTRRSDVSFHLEHFHTYISISATLYIHVHWHVLGVSWWLQCVLSPED